jgi:hypothetical protein
MSLKPDRNQEAWDVFNYMNEVADAGGAVVLSNNGSGVATDSPLNVVTYAANPSGKVVKGILLTQMEAYPAKMMRNFYKDSQPVGSKVSVLTRGWVVTNMIYPGTTPTAGAVAYVGQSGLLTPTNYAGSIVVGRFETPKDEAGFARVSVNLP